MKISRNEAIVLLNNWVTNPGLIQHCLSVGRVMEQIAMANGEDPQTYFIAGVLHDADWQKYPDQHPHVIVNYLTELGEETLAHAISAHGTEWNVPYKSLMDRALVATDELTGLVCAVAKVTNGLSTLSAESVIKKFRNEKFASGIDRAEVKRALSILGVELAPFIEFIIASLQPYAEEIGLSPTVSEFKQPVFPSIKISKIHQDSFATTRRLSDEEVIRRQKREALLSAGIDPYPGKAFPVDTYAVEFQEGKIQPGKIAKMSGRLMVIRIQGKVAFCELQDATGKVQLYIHRDTLCPFDDKFIYDSLFVKYIDRGDFIGVEGELFHTKTGVLTVNVNQLHLLTKSIKPIPAVKRDEAGNIYDAFNDPELRFRQRYIDLLLNPQVKDIFMKRTQIVDTIRLEFNRRGYYEAQTPILQPIYGGASARPFKTHHNALDMPLYLRIANELYLKRLIVGGFDGVYEFSVDFRNEGMSRFHNPEFTQVELYVAYQDYEWMMSLVEETVEKVCLKLHGTTHVETFGHRIEFKRPWQRITMRDAILEKTGIDIMAFDEEGLRQAIKNANINDADTSVLGKGNLVDELFSTTVEKTLIQPTFITEYPLELSPLAKKTQCKFGIVDRFEGFVCGKEFCNAFSELNDPIDQLERFEEQLTLAKRGDNEAINEIDWDFLRALEYGMPPTAGLGLGIDRLTMIMTNSQSIQEVILFPHMRPE